MSPHDLNNGPNGEIPVDPALTNPTGENEMFGNATASQAQTAAGSPSQAQASAPKRTYKKRGPSAPRTIRASTTIPLDCPMGSFNAQSRPFTTPPRLQPDHFSRQHPQAFQAAPRSYHPIPFAGLNFEGSTRQVPNGDTTATSGGYVDSIAAVNSGYIGAQPQNCNVQFAPDNDSWMINGNNSGGVTAWNSHGHHNERYGNYHMNNGQSNGNNPINDFNTDFPWANGVATQQGFDQTNMNLGNFQAEAVNNSSSPESPFMGQNAALDGNNTAYRQSMGQSNMHPGNFQAFNNGSTPASMSMDQNAALNGNNMVPVNMYPGNFQGGHNGGAPRPMVMSGTATTQPGYGAPYHQPQPAYHMGAPNAGNFPLLRNQDAVSPTPAKGGRKRKSPPTTGAAAPKRQNRAKKSPQAEAANGGAGTAPTSVPGQLPGTPEDPVLGLTDKAAIRDAIRMGVAAAARLVITEASVSGKILNQALLKGTDADVRSRAQVIMSLVVNAVLELDPKEAPTTARKGFLDAGREFLNTVFKEQRERGTVFGEQLLTGAPLTHDEDLQDVRLQIGAKYQTLERTIWPEVYLRYLQSDKAAQGAPKPNNVAGGSIPEVHGGYHASAQAPMVAGAAMAGQPLQQQHAMLRASMAAGAPMAGQPMHHQAMLRAPMAAGAPMAGQPTHQQAMVGGPVPFPGRRAATEAEMEEAEDDFGFAENTTALPNLAAGPGPFKGRRRPTDAELEAEDDLYCPENTTAQPNPGSAEEYDVGATQQLQNAEVEASQQPQNAPSFNNVQPQAAPQFDSAQQQAGPQFDDAQQHAAPSFDDVQPMGMALLNQTTVFHPPQPHTGGQMEVDMPRGSATTLVIDGTPQEEEVDGMSVCRIELPVLTEIGTDKTPRNNKGGGPKPQPIMYDFSMRAFRISVRMPAGETLIVLPKGCERQEKQLAAFNEFVDKCGLIVPETLVLPMGDDLVVSFQRLILEINRGVPVNERQVMERRALEENFAIAALYVEGKPQQALERYAARQLATQQAGSLAAQPQQPVEQLPHSQELQSAEESQPTPAEDQVEQGFPGASQTQPSQQVVVDPQQHAGGQGEVEGASQTQTSQQVVVDPQQHAGGQGEVEGASQTQTSQQVVVDPQQHAGGQGEVEGASQTQTSQQLDVDPQQQAGGQVELEQAFPVPEANQDSQLSQDNFQWSPDQSDQAWLDQMHAGLAQVDAAQWSQDDWEFSQEQYDQMFLDQPQAGNAQVDVSENQAHQENQAPQEDVRTAEGPAFDSIAFDSLEEETQYTRNLSAKLRAAIARMDAEAAQKEQEQQQQDDLDDFDPSAHFNAAMGY
ncbi:hypothetical protein QBC39DRAFT_383052 [Podospora conica]|nr:hypothetical protein QBC39DRAFT_383052 [Schizothecium conicum]